MGDGRFVDKTPDNAMGIPYLLDLFPHAHVVWVKRDPRAVLNSLLSGWEHPLGRFRTYFVPEPLSIPGYASTRQWCFGLVEGWRDLRSSPITAVVAEQYRQYNLGALMGRTEVAPDHWHEVTLEELCSAPDDTATTLLTRLGLEPDEAVLARARRLRGQAENTMQLAAPSDWRDHEEAVVALVHELGDVITTTGYDVDGLVPGRD